jgi:hypothetical protein
LIEGIPIKLYDKSYILHIFQKKRRGFILRTLSLENIQAIFIDRDGTIGGDNTVHYPGEFSLFPFTEKIIEILKGKILKFYLLRTSRVFLGVKQVKRTLLKS